MFRGHSLDYQDYPVEEYQDDSLCDFQDDSEGEFDKVHPITLESLGMNWREFV
jgi:hypothetical protein